MEHRVAGDSIRFETVLLDRDGTAITNSVVTLSVVDGNGSTVVNGASVSHVSGGTYGVTGSTAGWNNGPITETWQAKHSSGTITDVVSNKFRIIGTSTIQPYVFASELKTFYENIEDYFTGDEDALVVDAFNEVNNRLEAMGMKLPFRVKTDGFYDQPLRDLNAYEAILRIVSRRQTSHNREDEKPWFTYFKDEAGSLYKKFQNKEYNFDRDYSVSESGIGIATKVAGTRPAVMETNWRGGIGTGFQDFTFERDWKVVLTGTGTAGEINEGTFKWSRDGGLNFATSFITDFEWQHLLDGVYVRFHKGTSTGSVNLFATNDEWNFKTFPSNQTVAGKRSAKSY